MKCPQCQSTDLELIENLDSATATLIIKDGNWTNINTKLGELIDQTLTCNNCDWEKTSQGSCYGGDLE
jgi:hypothetical protein